MTTQPFRSAAESFFASLPSQFPQQMDLLEWCQRMQPGTAVLLIAAGLVYGLFGFGIHKWLITLNAVVVGGVVGAFVGQKTGAIAAATIIGAFVAAMITWQLMKWAVAVMGGICGAVLGASIWLGLRLDPNFVGAGAALGLVTLGLLSFIIFRGSVMMYTAMQGSVMFVFGLLGLAFKYQEIGAEIVRYVARSPSLLPMTIFIPTVLAVLYQQAQAGGKGGGAAGGGEKKPAK